MPDLNLGNIFYSITAKDMTGAGTNAAKGNFVAAGLAIGASLTAVAFAADKVIDMNTKLMKSVEDVAAETGISAEAIRKLSLELSNGKDSIDEVSHAMETLGKYGIENEEDMRIATEAALTLADANNMEASAVANSVIPALQAYGLTVDDLGAKSDALTEITHSTKYGLTEVTNLLARTAPTAYAAGVSFDDMTIMIEAMGQKGVPARQAIARLNAAVKEAAASNKDGKVTVEGMATALGLTTEQFTKAKVKIDEASGSTKKYDDIAESHIGIMANFSHWWEVTATNAGAALTQYSGLFQALTIIAPVFTMVNGLLMLNNTLHIASAVSTAASTAATTVATTAQWLFNIALNANPIGLIILGVMGLVAVIVLLEQKFHFIQPALEWFSNALGSIAGFLKNVAEAILNNPIVSGMINAAVAVGGVMSHAVSGHASGGSMGAGEPGVVGESGPELFVPSSPGNVIPNSQLMNMGGQSHEWNISIVVNGANKDGKQIGLDVVRQIRQARYTMGVPTSR